MKVLNIVRSEPDEMIQKFVEAFSENNKDKVVALYKKDVDWEEVVDDIFAHDRVICWW
jgi:hypothetical protein